MHWARRIASPPTSLPYSQTRLPLSSGTGTSLREGSHLFQSGDVEKWLQLGQAVQPDDIELFALPPSKQAGHGGDFNAAPQPVPIKGRLKRVRQAFGQGRALVINSLHRWCPKAAKLAATLREQVGLPVDVYMYLTPPYSHSYGVHADVMDAFMVQLVGRKQWKACDRDALNCTEVETANGDVLYLPMGAKHGAWTRDDLSAHLTVNVERQFYVWGSIFQAVAKHLLLPEAVPQLERLRDMRPFGMEEEGPDATLVRFVSKLASRVPSLMQMPQAVLNHTRSGSPLGGKRMEVEWSQLLAELAALNLQEPFKLTWQGKGRNFPSVNEMIQELSGSDEQRTRASLTWVARLIKRSVQQMHEDHAQQRLPMEESSSDAEELPPEQLGALAQARISQIQKSEL